jgi:gamma-glutamylcyclotransferase (GGCT)/AIG2-like uncharacterized protein YtfP
MHYFAYGSNLCTRYLQEYCPSATYVMKADLPNYKIQFRRYSHEMQGGISTIMEAPGNLVRGVIYEVSKNEIGAMDLLEDVPQEIYLRETFLVLGADGSWHRADLYRVAEPAGPYPPAKRYLDLMIEGAREHALDPDYVEDLETLRQSLD